MGHTKTGAQYVGEKSKVGWEHTKTGAKYVGEKSKVGWEHTKTGAEWTWDKTKQGGQWVGEKSKVAGEKTKDFYNNTKEKMVGNKNGKEMTATGGIYFFFNKKNIEI